MKNGFLIPALAAVLLTTGTAAPVLAQGGKPGLYQLPPVTADDLIGRWGDNGDCTKDVFFNQDGTFQSYTGGGGRWALNGDQLTLAGPGGEFVMRVRWGDSGRLIITNPDGSEGFSQRC